MVKADQAGHLAALPTGWTVGVEGQEGLYEPQFLL